MQNRLDKKECIEVSTTPFCYMSIVSLFLFRNVITMVCEVERRASSILNKSVAMSIFPQSA